MNPSSSQSDGRDRQSDDQGGDAACWAHLFEEQPEPPSDHVLATLIHDLADGVIIGDPEGLITLWNEAASRIFGWDAADVLGKPLDLIIPERFRKRHSEGYERVMETGVTKYGNQLLEVPALHHDGHTISVAFTVSLLKGTRSSRPDGIAAVIRDETDRYAELKSLRAHRPS